MKILLTLILLAILTSCSNHFPPTENLIESAPIIQIGNKDVVPANHIVYIPANTKFPITFSVKGDILQEIVSTRHIVSFKQDMYLYKKWASLDGKNWKSTAQLLNIRSSTVFDKSGGKVEIQLNTKEEEIKE
jgi:hypothetical protein